MNKRKKKPALEYFKHIDELEEEYTAKHLLKNSAFDKFWHKIIKNNINPDGKLSTQELIDIIREDKAPVVERVIKTTSPILSKNNYFHVYKVNMNKCSEKELMFIKVKETIMTLLNKHEKQLRKPTLIQ